MSSSQPYYTYVVDDECHFLFVYDYRKYFLAGDVAGSRMGMGVVVGSSPSMESVSASEPQRRHRRATFVIYGMVHGYCFIICDVTV